MGAFFVPSLFGLHVFRVLFIDMVNLILQYIWLVYALFNVNIMGKFVFFVFDHVFHGYITMFIIISYG